jgi:hypothetical protein
MPHTIAAESITLSGDHACGEMMQLPRRSDRIFPESRRARVSALTIVGEAALHRAFGRERIAGAQTHHDSLRQVRSRHAVPIAAESHLSAAIGIAYPWTRDSVWRSLEDILQDIVVLEALRFVASRFPSRKEGSSILRQKRCAILIARAP